MNTFEGKIIGNIEGRIAIVVSRFNEFMTKALLEGATSGLDRHGFSSENIDVYWVPGAYEIPLLTQKLAQSNKYVGMIALGAVIKGDTTHYDYVCSAVSSGITRVSLDFSIPIMFGILTTNSIEQTIERSGSKMGNKGYECAVSLLEMVNLLNLK